MTSLSLLVLYASTLTRPVAVKTFRAANQIIQRDTGFSFRPKLRPVRAGKLVAFDGGPLAHYAPLLDRYGTPGRRTLLLVEQGFAPYGGEAVVCGDRAVAGVRVVSELTKAVVPEATEKAFVLSWTATAHELGHVLGAGHTADATLMNPAVGKDKEFSETSRNEIAACMVRIGF